MLVLADYDYNLDERDINNSNNNIANRDESSEDDITYHSSIGEGF